MTGTRHVRRAVTIRPTSAEFLPAHHPGLCSPTETAKATMSFSATPQSELSLSPASTGQSPPSTTCFYQVPLCFLPQNSWYLCRTPILSCEKPKLLSLHQLGFRNQLPTSLPTTCHRSTGEPHADGMSYERCKAQQRRTHVFEAADRSCLEAMLLQVLSPVKAQDECYKQT